MLKEAKALQMMLINIRQTLTVFKLQGIFKNLLAECDFLVGARCYLFECETSNYRCRNRSGIQLAPTIVRFCIGRFKGITVSNWLMAFPTNIPIPIDRHPLSLVLSMWRNERIAVEKILHFFLVRLRQSKREFFRDCKMWYHLP